MATVGHLYPYEHAGIGGDTVSANQFGNALASTASSQLARQELFFSASVDGGPIDIMRHQCEATLAILGLDHLDLALLSWPNFGTLDSTSAFDVRAFVEVFEGMQPLVQAGLCRGLGVCHMTSESLEQALPFLSAPPAAVCMELHPKLPQEELVQLCHKHGIAAMGMAPFATPTRWGTASEEHPRRSFDGLFRTTSWLRPLSILLFTPRMISHLHASLSS